MKYKWLKIIVFLFLLSSFFYSCDHCVDCDTPDDPPKPLNPKIKLIRRSYDYSGGGGGKIFMAVTNGKNLYSTQPIRHMVINDNFERTYDSVYMDIKEIAGGGFISYNKTLNKLLIVTTNQNGRLCGNLSSYDLDDRSYTEILNYSYLISSAFYNPINDDEIYLYTYGKENVLEAGYYKFTISTQSFKLLIAYRSKYDISTGEAINGFDVRADGKKIIYPFYAENDDGLLLEYDLDSQKVDTVFKDPEKYYLWARYHPINQDLLLLLKYPDNILGGTGVRGPSKMYIYFRNSKLLKELDVRTNSYMTLAVFPNWSVENNAVFFGSDALNNGDTGFYDLYVLNQIDKLIN